MMLKLRMRAMSFMPPAASRAFLRSPAVRMPSDSAKSLLNAGHLNRGAWIMIRIAYLAGAALAFTSSAAFADPSSGHKDQARGEAEIPVCTHRIGTLAIVPPDKEWWRELNLGSPEAIIKVFVAQSGCFTMVNRDRAMNSRSMERALADSGELQRGSR